MATLHNASSNTAVSRNLAFDLRNQSTVASASVHQNAKWAKNLLGDLGSRLGHNFRNDSTSTDSPLQQVTALRYCAHLLPPHGTTLDPAFSWSSGIQQAVGDMNPYDLHNGLLSSGNKPTFPNLPIEMKQLFDASGRVPDGTESWAPSCDRGNSELHFFSSESTSSAAVATKEGTSGDEHNSCYKNLGGNNKTLPCLGLREKAAYVKGSLPHYLHTADQSPGQPHLTLSMSTKGEAPDGRVCATKSSKLVNVLSHAQSSGPSLQSSNILTFHNNVNKLSLPSSPSLKDAEHQEGERQDGTLHRSTGLTDPELPKESKLKNLLTLVDEGFDATTTEIFKRPKLSELSSSTALPSKTPQTQARKLKIGDRITALQQLVSPFGKTDTASVLLEAIGYIKFLQDQVQVLSSPYMKPMMGRKGQGKDGGEMGSDLRSRGLCLVPVSCTLHVANSNGADYWTSGVGGGSSRY